MGRGAGTVPRLIVQVCGHRQNLGRHIPARPTDFGQFICVLFSVFSLFYFSVLWPVVPLLDRWCPWQACGGPEKYVVSLLGLWCP